MEYDLNVAICDDSAAALKSEREMIESVLQEKGLTYNIDQYGSASDLLTMSAKYDVVFLDIEMDGQDGITAAKRLRKLNDKCLIIFVTNHDSYLDEAFNQYAFRFWTKPLDRCKLEYGIESALKRMDEKNHYVTLKVNSTPVRTSVNSVIYFYILNKKVHVITVKGEMCVNDSFKRVMEMFEGYKNFCETHSGYCVNFNYVKNFNDEAAICEYNGATYQVYISRRKAKDFKKKFFEWLGDK